MPDAQRSTLKLDDGPARLVAARKGHFLLESGHHGNLWLDLDRLLLRPRLLAPYVTALAARLGPSDVEIVCGPLAGGAFVAQMVAATLDVAFCYSERVPIALANDPHAAAYGIPSGIRSTVAGKRVAVVDDAINIGAAVGGTLAALRAAGAVPVVVGALIELDGVRQEPRRFDGLLLVSLATIPAAAWLPKTCPLCAVHVPLERPGHV